MNKWNDYLSDIQKKQAKALAERAQSERDAGKTIYPPQDSIFRALELVAPEDVKVVIVGQDPYHNEGEANGLAFSVGKGVRIPPSLRNIFQELHDDIGCPIPQNGDLTPWAEQGVLLLNTVLTVEAGKPGSHSQWQWQSFVSSILYTCAKMPQPIVFILWGGYARSFAAGIPLSQLPNKACIWSSHPSPFSARSGNEVVPAFIGSRPFSQANRLLASMGAQTIDWSL